MFPLPIIDLRTGEIAYQRIADPDRSGLERAAELAASQRPVRIAVSVAVLTAPSFLEDVLVAVRLHHAQPAMLTFEVPESDEPRVLRVTRALVACGFACEPEAKPLTIKRTLVREIHAAPMNRRLVEATVAVARSLGQKTIAEGVEDVATLGLLRTLGVDYAVAG